MYQEFLTKTLNEASKIAKQMFGKVEGRLKDGDPIQVLTEADLKIGKFIIGEIEKYFPEHNIIDEEAGAIDKKSEFTWVIDPIDGTANFAHKIPLYGIMIGLLKDCKPLAGGVALPEFGKIYIAEKGEGTFLNGEKLDISDSGKIKTNIIAYGLNGNVENPELTRKEGKYIAEIVLGYPINNSSNSVYDTCLVLEGHYAGVLNQTSKIWDNVAPQIITQEAGGVFSDFYGEELDYSDCFNKMNRNYTNCTASPGIHKKLQEIIHNL
ncbi:inositol monophosphatase [bacterium]|nr:MAG: inositol monophosphatase [bacterium]